VLVVYDPVEVSYSRLAELLFERIPDPTMLNRVGKDRGTQYRTGMYAHSPQQLLEAQRAFDRENKMWFGREVVTEVAEAKVFWPAEENHQRYLEKGDDLVASSQLQRVIKLRFDAMGERGAFENE